MGVVVRPVPVRRRPVQVGLSADGVDTVDARGRPRSWPRSVVAGLRLLSIGATGTDPAGVKVPLASGLAVDGHGGELIRLPWWGIGHEALEQAATAAGVPLRYAEGRAAPGGERRVSIAARKERTAERAGSRPVGNDCQPTLHRPRWKVPTPVALSLGPTAVGVIDRDGRQVSWPRVGHPSGGGRATPPGSVAPSAGVGHLTGGGRATPPGTVAPSAVPVPPVARLRLYRDYNTGSWLKAVSLVDPWRRELVLIRWDTLAGAGPMHDAACAAGLLPEFCWESELPDQIGVGRVPLIV